MAPIQQPPRLSRIPGSWPWRHPPSPGGAALRSALVPGWGQWAAGRRRRGVLLLVFSILAVTLPAAFLFALLYPLLPLALSPGWQAPAAGLANALHGLVAPAIALLEGQDWAAVWRIAVAANGAALLFRAWAALDAAICARVPSGHIPPSRQDSITPPGGIPSRPASGTPADRPSSRALLPRWAQRRPAANSQRSTLNAQPRVRASALISALAAVLATIVVVAPHLGLAIAGYATVPLLAQVLVPQPRLGTDAPPPPPAAATAVAEAGRPVWDSKTALNVLLLGTDRRPQESDQQPWGNSDTILLVSVDPVRQSAAMISVPRDIYLDDIPGVGPEKINAAYRHGGPELAVTVIGDLLGVPIHRWASVDVTAFATMIDAVGGVVIDVERPIRDDEYPTENYAVRRIRIPAGLQWLDGERALWYARSRHASDDFDRADRQQRLLLALKARARDPRIVSRIPALVNSLADAIQTDVSPLEALTLARLGATTDLRAVRSLVLTPPEYGRVINRPDLYAIIPNRERIRADVATLLAADPAPGTVSAAAGSDSLPLPPADAAPRQGGPGPTGD
ncbi:MAG: LCP family protein [Chloroflexota bacterium]